MAPNQVLELENDVGPNAVISGWGVFFHPDLIRATSLFAKMKDYSFFTYEVAEALHLKGLRVKSRSRTTGEYRRTQPKHHRIAN